MRFCTSVFALAFVTGAASQSATAGIIFLDDFESGSLADWTFASPPGTFATNTIQYGIESDGTNVLSMSGGVEHPGGGGGTHAGMVLPGSTLTDYVVSADMKILDFVNGGSHHAVLGRVQDASHHYEIALQSETHLGDLVTRAIMVRWDGGSDGSILATQAISVATGDWHNLRAEFVGDHITAWLDNQQILSVQDSTYSTGGFGVMNAGAHTHFDNFQVTEPVPEPATAFLLGTGGLTLLACGWRRRKVVVVAGRFPLTKS